MDRPDDENAASPKGVRCPRCWCRDSFVSNTEQIRSGVTRRRRTCRHCGRRFVTFESTGQGLSSFLKRLTGGR